MHPPEPHPLEEGRLQNLRSYTIMDTLPEEDYDNLTALAAHICGTHISLVSLLDEQRQWFKSRYGLNATQTPKDLAFCAHAIHHPDQPFIVPDAREDERFSDNPLVTGDPHVIFYAGIPLVSEAGFPLGTLCVIDDQPRQLSSDQIQALKVLARQVMQLLEIRKKNRLLQQKISQLEQKNQELQRFASVAAHDLRSPLRNIHSLAQALLEDYGESLQEDGKEMLQMLQGSSEKLSHLVNGLLEHSKSENLLQKSQTTFSIHQLWEEIQSLFSSPYTALIESELEEITTNRVALQQILINLLSNALKYSDKKEPVVELGVERSGPFYRFYLYDNGPGIPAEYHQRIFRIFEVLSPTDNSGQAGTGIGLAIVKKLVEGLGGEIWVESEPAKGTTFHFTLPA